MGLFNAFKQLATPPDVSVSIILDNPVVTIGGTLTGTLTMVATNPVTINRVQLSVLRKLSDAAAELRPGGEANTDREIYKFTDEYQDLNASMQAGETKTVPLSLVVGDGVNVMQVDGNVAGIDSKTFGTAVANSVMPKGPLADYVYVLTAKLEIDGQNKLFAPAAIQELTVNYPGGASVTVTSTPI